MAKNIADLFEHAVDAVPERTALVCDGVRQTYASLDAEANQMAHHLTERGVRAGSHVGLYARNVREHVVAMVAVLKVRAVPINVNYRYVASELDYLFDNAEITALVHERQYTPLVAEVFDRHIMLEHAVVIEDGTDYDFSSYGGVSWADALSGRSREREFGPRSDDDLYIVYTGGTTGYPKGVMWRHEDVWRTLGGGIDFATQEHLDEFDQSNQARAGKHLVSMQLGPIMHGNGQWGMLLRFFGGHTVVMLPKFEPAEIWRTIERENAQSVSMIGDAMALPLIEEYESGNYDGSSLTLITNSAALFSASVKQRWATAFPNALLTDAIGSSETGFTGSGRVDSTTAFQGPQVRIGSGTVVLDEDNNILDPTVDIGAVGQVARSGHVPLGYYNDPEKSAQTFVEIDGIRYSVPGDFVRIEEGERLTLLGRGSGCINTGGEKVFPEEVETALKSHKSVFDALVVGVPDQRYGQSVAAVVQPIAGQNPTLDEITDSLRGQLSGYKLPRSLTVVPEIPRHVTGKANYPEAERIAAEAREQD